MGVGKGIRQLTVRARRWGRGSIGATWWRGCLVDNLLQQLAAAADVVIGADGVTVDADVEGNAHVRVKHQLGAGLPLLEGLPIGGGEAVVCAAPWAAKKLPEILIIEGGGIAAIDPGTLVAGVDLLHATQGVCTEEGNRVPHSHAHLCDKDALDLAQASLGAGQAGARVGAGGGVDAAEAEGKLVVSGCSGLLNGHLRGQDPEVGTGDDAAVLAPERVELGDDLLKAGVVAIIDVDAAVGAEAVIAAGEELAGVVEAEAHDGADEVLRALTTPGRLGLLHGRGECGVHGVVLGGGHGAGLTDATSDGGGALLGGCRGGQK